jgi:hypothetical protein
MEGLSVKLGSLGYSGTRFQNSGAEILNLKRNWTVG